MTKSTFDKHVAKVMAPFQYVKLAYCMRELRNYIAIVFLIWLCTIHVTNNLHKFCWSQCKKFQLLL